jgi:hypothetical protein
LLYGTSHWTELTDVLFRGLKKWGPIEVGLVEDLRDRYAAWRGFAPIRQDYKPDLDKKERLESYIRPVSHMLMTVLDGIQIFIISSGKLGLVKSVCNIQVDDKVYVLFGGSTPYILRNDGEQHCVICPCYLHGFMDGEAIAGWRIGKYKSREVTLI